MSCKVENCTETVYSVKMRPHYTAQEHQAGKKKKGTSLPLRKNVGTHPHRRRTFNHFAVCGAMFGTLEGRWLLDYSITTALCHSLLFPRVGFSPFSFRYCNSSVFSAPMHKPLVRVLGSNTATRVTSYAGGLKGVPTIDTYLSFELITSVR